MKTTKDLKTQLLEEWKEKFAYRIDSLESIYQLHGGEPWKGKETIPVWLSSALSQMQQQTEQDIIERVRLEFARGVTRDEVNKRLDALMNNTHD